MDVVHYVMPQSAATAIVEVCRALQRDLAAHDAVFSDASMQAYEALDRIASALERPAHDEAQSRLVRGHEL